MAHSYVCGHIHVIFSTKNRAPIIVAELMERLWAYVGGIARENKMKALAVGGTENHIHALVSLPSTTCVAKAVQLIKGGSSKWVSDTFPPMREFEWQEGYGAFNVSASLVPKVIEYVRNQAEHHRERTFDEEFVAFLEKHGIAYDPRYVFG
jgi:REP element-mobilizing transposase RayT